MLLDDQVKLNDPGASQYLIETLAQDGWNGLLRFYEGEVWRLRNRPGDESRAAQSYAAAVAYPDAPADAWRWHGISLMKAGPPRRGEGGVRPLSDDEAGRARRRLGAADDRLRGARDEALFASSVALARSALSACSSLGGEGYGFSDYSLVRVRRVNVGDGSMSVVPPRAVEPPPPDPVRGHPRGRGLDLERADARRDQLRHAGSGRQQA